ncbi:hypothetical protein MHF_0326 [Mycoplasma haemofelis Ohio2]|uniref:Uncharacterized protein n=1 Tax=Mycoplasma haemofelis (strain Ohio2) TaxID=859194 RepID=F6FGT2_MYCHI|nr:hypothetical protein MHF_0326 [Mycoplasma haemofelis Ohio2]
MTTAFKAASTFAAAGTATAGGIYFGTDIFKGKVVTKKTIASLLREKHPQKRLISSSSVSDLDWKKAYKTYREGNKERNKGQDIWKLDGWDRLSEVQEVDTTTEFISRCNSNKLVEVEGEQDPLYKQVLRYCTRDTLVKDLIFENTSKQLLNSASDQDTSGWTAAWEVYRTQNKASDKGKDAWEFSDWDSKKDKTELPADYKTKCDSKASIPAFKLDNEDYKNVLNWCTKN